MELPRAVLLPLLAFTLTGCAASTAGTGQYRQIWAVANQTLCANIDGTNTPVVSTCTNSVRGWGGQYEYYNSSTTSNPQFANFTVGTPQLINMASYDSSNPSSGDWYAIVITSATGDFTYSTVVAVPQGQGILITRVAGSSEQNHPGSSSVFCLPQSMIAEGQITPGQRYNLCSLNAAAAERHKK